MMPTSFVWDVRVQFWFKWLKSDTTVQYVGIIALVFAMACLNEVLSLYRVALAFSDRDISHDMTGGSPRYAMR